ncbi:MAG TPA: alpha/beta fold hydrolase [Longimicrobium sp.]|jgi:hypothetical protein
MRITTLLTVLALASAACTPTVVLSDRSLLAPRADTPAEAAALDSTIRAAGARGFTVPAADGAQLFGVVLRHPRPAATVLYFGGNNFRISQTGRYAATYLLPVGVNVVMVDYRGYGRSTGTLATVAQLEADALQVYDRVRAMPELAGVPLIVHGQSLGSFVAGHVATQRPVAGLVLEASATTAHDWVEASMRGRSVPPGTRVRVSESLARSGNLERVRRIRLPLMVLVGADDPVTPPALSERLFAESATPAALKRLHVVAGASHNDVPVRPAFRTAYAEFLGIVSSAAAQ